MGEYLRKESSCVGMDVFFMMKGKYFFGDECMIFRLRMLF